MPARPLFVVVTRVLAKTEAEGVQMSMAAQGLIQTQRALLSWSRNFGSSNRT